MTNTSGNFVRENVNTARGHMPNQRGRDADDSVEELCFDDDAFPPPRAGDPRYEAGESDPDISAQRAAAAGLTGGDVLNDSVDNEVTGDDLSPETLFDEDAVDNDKLVTADKDLSIVDEDEIGGGDGLDEAELARVTGRPN